MLTFWWLVYQINPLSEVYELKQNFQINAYWQNSVLCDSSILYFPFLYCNVLTLASHRTVLYGNIAVSVVVLSTKNQYSGLLKKVSVFQKIYFKVKVLKTLKISSGCHIKTWRSVKRRAILKITSTVF